jgi:Holliday junction resolvase
MPQKALRDTPVEKTVVKAIATYIRARGGYVVKQHGSQYTEVGVPDLLCCYAGTFMGIEVKRDHPASKASEAQVRHIERITNAGGLAFVARKVEDVKPYLDGIDAVKDRQNA